MDLEQLRQQHKDMIARARAIQQVADDENRHLTVDEARALEDLMGQADELDNRIGVEERLREHEEGSRRSFRQPTRPRPEADESRTPGQPVRFRSFGEQLRAVAAASRPGTRVDPRLIEQRAGTGMNEGSPSDGGFAVQQDFTSEIWRRAYQTGQILSRVRRIPISAASNGIKLPAVDETSRATGSRYGGVQAYWVNEGGSVTPTRPKLRLMELNLEKLMAVVYLTDELLADAAALEAYVGEALTGELIFQVENAIVRGSGAGQPLGILNSSALVTQAAEGGQTAATFSTANAAKMFGRVWAASLPNAVWLHNQDVYQQILQLTLTNEPMFIPPGRISEAPFGMLLGRPLLPVEYASTLGAVGDVLLADLSQYILIEKGGIQAASSIHVQFLTDEMAFRFIYRVDGQPQWSAALTPFQGSNTVAPFVALAAR